MSKSKEQLQKEGWVIFDEPDNLIARYCSHYQLEIFVNLDSGEYSFKVDRMISESMFESIKERYPI